MKARKKEKVDILLTLAKRIPGILSRQLELYWTFTCEFTKLMTKEKKKENAEQKQKKLS